MANAPQFFLFSNWPRKAVEIASKLLPYLCRNGAGLYAVDFPKEGRTKEVRVGWSNPLSEKKHILSILCPNRDGGLFWELRVGPKSQYISSKGPLMRLKLERNKAHQESQKAKGCRVLDSTALPKGFDRWIEDAFAYTQELHRID